MTKGGMTLGTGGVEHRSRRRVNENSGGSKLPQLDTHHRRDSLSVAPSPNAHNTASSGSGGSSGDSTSSKTSVQRARMDKRNSCSLSRNRNVGQTRRHSNDTAASPHRHQHRLGREPRILNYPIKLDRPHHGGDGGGKAAKTTSRSRDHSNEVIVTGSNHVRRLASRAAFYKLYEIGGLIGQGNFSEVYVVFNNSSTAAATRVEDCATEEKCAVKEIDKNRMHGKLHFVENEIALLAQCRHRNICALLDAYECAHYYFLVFEYARKGDLFETVKRMGRLSERLCAQVTRQVGSALAYLHSNSIVHRDVKPENVLLTGDFSVKLTDFGLACRVRGPLYRVCGTPTYVAPEILSQCGYGVKVDVWSLGVVLYITLIGHAPFRSLNRLQLFKLIMEAELRFDVALGWGRVSSGAKELLQRMLTNKVDERLSAAEIAGNEWIRDCDRRG